MRRWIKFVLEALTALGDAECPYATRYPYASRKATDDAFWEIVTRQWGDAARVPPGRRQTPSAGI